MTIEKKWQDAEVYECLQCHKKCGTDGGMMRHAKATGHILFMLPIDKLQLPDKQDTTCGN